jgi:membrane-associated protein
VFHWLTQEVSQNPLTYLVVFVASGADVLFPPIPSETIVITASVLAAQGELVIWFIVPLVALGAFIGDNASYWLGRGIGDPVAERLFSGEKGQARLLWAEEALAHRGVAAGSLEMPYRQFLFADAIAAVVWALYASMLGYLGGETFQDNIGLPLILSLGLAMTVGFGVELWRRIQRRRGKDVLGDELPEGAAE